MKHTLTINQIISIIESLKDCVDALDFAADQTPNRRYGYAIKQAQRAIKLLEGSEYEPKE